jgi:pyruvate formate lyase activating enzyme
MTVPTYPLIVDIKRHSLEDGPGIRSVVFFKGCPLRCVFCHNPETQLVRREIAFWAEACVGCGRCAEVCRENAIDYGNPGRIQRHRCVACGKCAEVCPARALRSVGRYYPPEGLVEVLLRDEPYYRHSGGGVTLSGGECTLFPRYLGAILTELKKRGIHVAVETCGLFNYRSFNTNVRPFVDLIFYDIKFADREAHRKCTGIVNDRILENLRRLARTTEPQLVPRVPLVPAVTLTEENLSTIASMTRKMGLPLILLPYNPSGLDKYERIGRTAPDLPRRFLSTEEQETARRFLGLFAVGR